MRKILVINGPNLNMIGKREEQIYGSKSMQEIEKECKVEGEKLDLNLTFFQSNSESEIISKIQNLENFDCLIINAGAFTHTSIAIHDSLKILKIPIIEIHISNIYQREDFRKNSFVSSVANGIIVGFGTDVYRMAVNSAKYLLKKNDKN